MRVRVDTTELCLVSNISTYVTGGFCLLWVFKYPVYLTQQQRNSSTTVKILTQRINIMNTLQAYKLLENALDVNNGHNSASTRAALLEMLEVYNELALANAGIYRPLKNASDTPDHVWIVPA